MQFSALKEKKKQKTALGWKRLEYALFDKKSSQNQTLELIAHTVHCSLSPEFGADPR